MRSGHWVKVLLCSRGLLAFAVALPSPVVFIISQGVDFVNPLFDKFFKIYPVHFDDFQTIFIQF